MKSKKLTSVIVMMMAVIIMIGTFCLPASAATSIKNAAVTYTQTYTYTGKAIKPAVTVKVGKTKLTKDKHYTVSYKNNTKVGKATITVTGKGSYKDKVTKYFYINPKAVTNLKATVYANKIKLSWTKATGATSYEIQQKISGSWKKIATTSNASYTVTGLSSATKYEFRVRATAKAGSKALNSSFQTITKTTTIGKASNLAVSDITENSATLKWGKVQGATSYRVTLTAVASGYKKNLTSTTNSLKLTSLSALAEYKVTVTALNSSKNLTGSASTALTFNTAPAGVTNLKATVAEDGSVSLTWSKVAGADGYKVSYDKLDASGNVVSTNSSDFLTKNSCSVKNLTPLTYYVFKVVSGVKTDSGYVYSKEVSTSKVLIPVTKVSGFTATASGSNIILKWERPNNIDGYKIYKDGVLVTSLDKSITTYTLTNVSGTSCKVAISAHYKNTEGAKSEATVSLSDTSVQSISFVTRPTSMKVGDTSQLSVKITPDTAANKNVTYSSSNTSVATVSSTGLITAKAAGTTTITATSAANSAKSVSFSLTVSSSGSGGNSGSSTGTVKVESVSLKSEYVLYSGDFVYLNPTISPANATDKTYTITGADTGSYKFSDYLTISSGGYITAKKATTDSSGNAFYFTITIKTNNSGKTATAKVKVLPRMLYVAYSGIDSSPWCYGNSAKLSVTFNEEIENKYSLSDVRFKSDDTSIATVNNSGVVTCTGVGDVTITAYTSDNKYSGDYRIYSRKNIKITDAFFGSCQVGKTYKISAEIIPSAGTDSLLYYSSDNSIATVDTKGVVTFKAPGSVMISVHNSTDPFSPKQVWFSSNSFTLPSGTNAQLLNSMRTSANAVKSLKNLPAINRYDETVTSDFSISSNKLSASDLQNIFNSELSPRNNYHSSVVYGDSNYTTLKTSFMKNVPVSGQSFVISPNLTESDIKNISVSNSNENHYYEMKLTLKDEYMSSLPTNSTATRHGKVFDILTDSYINTYLDKINNSGSMSITYSSFTQNYHDSTLTLRINKATGNIERAVYDMNLDVNVSKLKMKYSILLQYTMDVAFKCNNIVIIDFSDYN